MKEFHEIHLEIKSKFINRFTLESIGGKFAFKERNFRAKSKMRRKSVSFCVYTQNRLDLAINFIALDIPSESQAMLEF